MPRGEGVVHTGESEIFLFPPSPRSIKSVVVDASLVTANSEGRKIMLEGTLLTAAAGASPTGKKQYKRYEGSGLIEGILALRREFLDGSSQSDTPSPMANLECVFRASKIVDYSLYGNAAISTLSTCRFELV